MHAAESPGTGKVYLVGAGPGDPGLITLRAVACLARADVILYDYLANPQILKHARRDSQQICLGKHGRTRIWPQEEINEAMVRYARQGKTVVRLKGGDPIVFGRYAEESEALIKSGIPWEVVPGITAALAAGSHAGIPLTHRDVASAVALVTGQENPAKGDPSLDYEALARFPGTLVFYMGVTTVPRWSSALIEAGKSPDTPVAVIRHGSLPDQRTWRCTLGTVSDFHQHLRPPVVFVIGEVAREAGSCWFEQRVLFGQRVLVTRPIDQADSLANELAELGAQVLLQPAIEISEPDSWQAVDAALNHLSQFAWLVFSSANGVEYFLARLVAIGRDLRALGGLQIAAIGSGTAAALRRHGLQADLLPPEFRAESLAAALAPRCAGQRVLLARASRGREVLAEELQRAGAEVQQVVVYRSQDVRSPDAGIARLLEQGQIDWVTVTSSAIARALHAMFADSLQKSRLVSISPVTSATLRQLGLSPAAEATQYTMAGVVEAIQEAQGRTP